MKEDRDGLGVYSRYMNLRAHDNIIFLRLVGHWGSTVITKKETKIITHKMALGLKKMSSN